MRRTFFSSGRFCGILSTNEEGGRFHGGIPGSAGGRRGGDPHRHQPEDRLGRPGLCPGGGGGQRRGGPGAGGAAPARRGAHRHQDALFGRPGAVPPSAGLPAGGPAGGLLRLRRL